MKVVSFAEVEAEAWDDVARASDDAWLMHSSAWLGIETTFFAASNLSFAIVDRGEVLAIQPLYFSGAAQGTPFGEKLVHSGIHRHCGLAVSPRLARGRRAGVERFGVRHVIETARALAADRVQLGVHTLCPRSRSRARDIVPLWVREFGFYLGLGFGPTGIIPAPGFSTLAADQLVDLRRPEEEIFQGLDEACRRAIRKARKEGLRSEVSADPANLDRYCSLAQASATRTGEVLPPRDYYARLLAELGPNGHAFMVFARKAGADLAALLLLKDKGAVSFLAGVSDPDALALRPNDFVHWSAIVTARAEGADTYRLGPIFPEVPTDWPIARVSSFKGKFGAESVPMVVGSLFLNRERALAQIAAAREVMSAFGMTKATVGAPAPSLQAELVAHRLRCIGVDATAAGSDRTGSVVVADACTEGGWVAAREASARGLPSVVLRAWHSASFLDGVRAETVARDAAERNLRAAQGGRDLRTFHPLHTIAGGACRPVVVDGEGAAVWSWHPDGKAGVLLVGSDLARDLMLLTQGDAGKVGKVDGGGRWGYANERPNYLFEAQVLSTKSDDRPADWWMWTLRQALTAFAGVSSSPVLPFDAPGVVIVTGDDDQATFQDYRGQATKLGRLPVTYFLHPQAKLDRAALEDLAGNRTVEWELHPDALETPAEYRERFAEQAAWFQARLGRPARAVRNHGFLNDGYWNHARVWLEHGVVASSNLPGFDGCVLNGSLLPGRLALDGDLTSHWSVLTLFGDGVFFVHGWDADTARNAVRKAAQGIVASGVPGAIVMNLHPANHDVAAGLHEAAHDLVARMGFCAMTLGAAIEWFAARDRGEEAHAGAGTIRPFTRTRPRRSPGASLKTIPGPGRVITDLVRRARRVISVEKAR